MPTYSRTAADANAEAICLTAPTVVETPFGRLQGKPGDWVVTDYKGAHRIYSYDEFKDKFNPFDQEATTYLNQNKPPPSITNLEPTHGTTLATVWIAGSLFGANQGNSKVYFGHLRLVEAVVASWSDSLISVTVPAGLPTEYPIFVQVKVGTKFSNAYMFQVT